MKKVAVILFNLGGPTSLKAVRPFLFNLFHDPAIISLPQPFRFMLASFISFFRTAKAKKIYAEIGGKSPILEETQRQVDALQAALNAEFSGKRNEYRVWMSMRYWRPFAKDVALEVRAYEPDSVV